MTVDFNIYFFALLVSVTFVSCKNTPDNSIERVDNEAFQAMDTIDSSTLLAAFRQDSSYSLLLKLSDDSTKVLKLTKRLGFSAFVDTLKRINFNEFASGRFNFSYYVNDSSVHEIYRQKIIHPSSNWQGQTPGQENIESIFYRFDKKLNRQTKKID